MKNKAFIIFGILLLNLAAAQAASRNMYRVVLQESGPYGNDCMAAAKAAATVTYRISAGNGVTTPGSGAIFPEIDKANPNRISITVNATSQAAKTYLVDVNQTAQACEIKAIVEK